MEPGSINLIPNPPRSHGSGILSNGTDHPSSVLIRGIRIDLNVANH